MNYLIFWDIIIKGYYVFNRRFEIGVCRKLKVETEKFLWDNIFAKRLRSMLIKKCKIYDMIRKITDLLNPNVDIFYMVTQVNLAFLPCGNRYMVVHNMSITLH